MNIFETILKLESIQIKLDSKEFSWKKTKKSDTFLFYLFQRLKKDYLLSRLIKRDSEREEIYTIFFIFSGIFFNGFRQANQVGKTQRTHLSKAQFKQISPKNEKILSIFYYFNVCVFKNEKKVLSII